MIPEALAQVPPQDLGGPPPSKRPTREVDVEEVRRRVRRMMDTVPPPPSGWEPGA